MHCCKMSIGLLCAVVFLAVRAQAGLVILNTNESKGQSGTTTNQEKMCLEKDRIRVEMKGPATDQAFIFRQDKEVFWFIDNNAKTYTEMTKADLENMQTAIKQMQENLKNLPAEQRAMIQKSMQATMPFSAPHPVYKKVTSGEKVNQWTCDKYEGYLDNKKQDEIWTTDPKKLGFSADDFAVVQEMGKFFEGFTKMSIPFYKVGSEEWAKEQGYAGMPVKTISSTNGQATNTREIKEIKRQDLPAALFELPAGLKKSEMH
jgi:hypothetical protein